MKPEENDFDLTPPEDYLRVREVQAVLALISTNGNMAEAYRIAGYKGGRHDAARFFRRPKLKRAVAAHMARLIASGDEALARLTLYLRADIRRAFPQDKWLAGLPDEVAFAIKSVTPTKFGRRVEFHDPLRSAQLLAISAGRLKQTVEVEHTLEDIVARAGEPEKVANQLEPEKVSKQLGPGTDE